MRASYHNAESASVAHVQAGDSEPVFMIRDLRPDRPQAIADAEAKLLELHRRTGTIELTMPGDPALLAESPVLMRGWGNGVDGPWIVRRATHVYSSAGYTTKVAADTAPSAERPTIVEVPPSPLGLSWRRQPGAAEAVVVVWVLRWPISGAS